MKYIHMITGLVFGALGVMALALLPFIFIMADGIAAGMVATICGICGLLCSAFLSAAENAERYEREAIQHELRWRNRNNGCGLTVDK